MTKELFVREVSRLTAAFPEGGMNDATLELWWEKFQVIPEKLFVRGIEKVINRREYKSLPTVAEILKSSIGDQHHLVPYRRRSGDPAEVLDQILLVFKNKAKSSMALETRVRARLNPPEQEVDSLRVRITEVEALLKATELRARSAEEELGKREKRIEVLNRENKQRGEALARMEKLFRDSKTLVNHPEGKV